MCVIEDTVAKLELMKSLAKQIEACRIEARKLPELESKYAAKHKELTEALDSMDVTARGNFGWERRIVPFLTAFMNYAQAAAISAKAADI